ncbi:hypothetical protein [Candidatus Ruthia endofausta]|nr:hypothetical protein [Candidatus Ruthia endofausta]
MVTNSDGNTHVDKVNKGVAMSMAMDGIPQTFNGKGSIRGKYW